MSLCESAWSQYGSRTVQHDDVVCLVLKGEIVHTKEGGIDELQVIIFYLIYRIL